MLHVTSERLVSVWSRWDDHPRNEYAAVEFEAACQEWAEYHGTTATVLRACLADARRDGVSRSRALEAA